MTFQSCVHITPVFGAIILYFPESCKTSKNQTESNGLWIVLQWVMLLLHDRRSIVITLMSTQYLLPNTSTCFFVAGTFYHQGVKFVSLLLVSSLTSSEISLLFMFLELSTIFEGVLDDTGVFWKLQFDFT